MHARGFTLLETVVAIAVAVLLGLLLFHVLGQLLLAGRLQAQRDTAQDAVLRLTDNLTTEEDDAWAIYVPPADVLGTSNGDGHEVDFFARDGKQQPYFWAYNYDASAHTLTRYRFGSPGGAASADVTYSDITGFSARTYPVTALQDASTPVYSPMYASATLQSGIVQFYPGMPWIAGGNNITDVHIEAEGYRRDVQLATSTAPSGFTVVLNYTPSPGPAALTVWPPAIRFPVSGTSIAYTGSRVPTLAQEINALLGGGTALAAGGCGTNVAQAFASASDMTNDVPLANATDPYDSGVTTDANGCMMLSGAYVSGLETLNESGYSGTFVDGAATTNPCTSSNVNESTAWSPAAATGPTASQYLSGGSTPTQLCYLTFAGSPSVAQQQAPAQVIQPCWVVGGSCTWVPNTNMDTAVCNRGFDYTDGWGANMLVSSSPLSAGTATKNADGSITFTRTGTGTVSISVRQEYVSYTSVATCARTFTYRLVDSISYPSV